MLNSFFRAICRVGIFMICAQAIMHFKAKETYEKYLKLLVSTMILIQLFLSIGNFLAGKSGLQAEDVLEQFNREVEQGMRMAEENAAATDAILERMTLEEIRNYMEQPTGESGGGENKREEGENRHSEEENGNRIEIEVEEIEPISIGTATSGE